MNPNNAVTLLLLAVAVVLGVGLVDAALGAEWDLFVVTAIALGLQLVLIVRSRGRRQSVPLRRDLVQWLRERSELSGEPISVIADRAVSHYRERFGAVADIELVQ